MSGPEATIGIIVLLIGLGIACFGWKIHRALIAIMGFLIGGALGFLLLGAALRDLGGALLAFFIVGVFSAWFFSTYEKIAVGLGAGFIGADIVADLTAKHTYSSSFFGIPVYDTQYNYPVIIIAFLISAYLGWQFYKLGYIIITSGIGASLISIGGAFIGFWGLANTTIPLLGAFLLGIIVQYIQEAPNNDLFSKDSKNLEDVKKPSNADLDELLKLKSLKDSGVLTEEEYEEEKKKLLK